MKRIALIDSTIRKESRTRRLTNGIISSFKDEVEFVTYNLNDLNLEVVTSHNFDEKANDAESFKMAKDIFSMDAMIISAPLWDMSFPALLKVFLERISVFDVAFKQEVDKFSGLANNKFMLLITTRGMVIEDYSPLDGASSYLKALCALWGIPKYEVISLNNLDFLSEEEVDLQIKNKIKEGTLILNNLIKEL